MTSISAVIGSTGLVGHQILATLLHLDASKTVYTISRRAPKTEPSAKLSATVEADTAKWASQFAALSPPPKVVFSALGTTRAQAGGIQNQWKIDHDRKLFQFMPWKKSNTFFFSFSLLSPFLNASLPK